MKYLIFISLYLYACSSTNSSLKKEITVEKFKDRALCDCIAIGLDSSRSNGRIQKIIPYDPVAAALYDSVILENLKPVLHKMYLDSINKIGKVTEAAQGKNVYSTCLSFYKSAELYKLAKYQIKKVRKIKNLEEFISSRYPTW
jgi:hypothetical protein